MPVKNKVEQDRPPPSSRRANPRAKNTSPAKRSGPDRALDQMPTEFRERCIRLRMKLAEVGPENTRVRYKMGVLVKDAQKAADKYGKGLVPQLACALGFDVKTLYRYAVVAKTWTECELEALLRRKGRTGRPIDFTHLVAIAEVSTAKGRSELIDAVLAEGLSQRELKQRINRPVRLVEEAEQDEDADEEARPGPKVGGPAPVTTSAGAVRSLRATLETWRQDAEHLERDLLPLFEGPVSAELVPQLEEIIAEEQELEQLLEHLRGRLRSLIEARSPG